MTPDYRVRAGRPDDLAAIRAMAEPGDYVPDEYAAWFHDGTDVLVAVDDSDTAVALMTLTRPGRFEAWLAAARVHPEHRRRGLASLLNRAGADLAAERGCRVVRLAIDATNLASQQQVASLGYRHTGDWVVADRGGLLADPNPTANGGPRIPGPERLEPATRLTALDAWPVWQRSALGRAARGLVAEWWTWWRLTPDDLEAFAADGRLHVCPSGWVVATVDDTRLDVQWLSPHGDDVRRLTKACIDLAVDLRLDAIRFTAPRIPGVLAAVERIRADQTHMQIWERPLAG